MSSTTTNFGLHKIDLNDAPPDITVLNQNWDTIDEELKEHSDRFNGLNGEYLPLTGGKLIGNVTIEKANPTLQMIGTDSNRKTTIGTGSNGVSVIGNYSVEDASDWSAYYLRTETVDLNTIAQVVRVVDGSAKLYNLFGGHNKPTGSYTGNGSATQRTINVGGVGEVLLIFGGNSSSGGVIAFVSYRGAVVFNITSGVVNYYKNDTLTFINGVLTIASANSYINGSGVPYEYMLL